MNCVECGKPVSIKSNNERCHKCREMIKRERAKRLAELPWYIFDRQDPTVAGANVTSPKYRPLDDVHHVMMSKKKFTD